MILVAQVGAGRGVLHIAVGLFDHAGNAHLDGIGQRHVDERLAADPVEPAVEEAAADAEGRSRLGRVERDIAAEAVAAIERALRPALDLHALEIDEGGERLAGAGLIDVVDVKGDARVGIGADRLSVDAADVRPRIGARTADLEPGSDVLQPGDVGDILLGERRAADRGDGERHVLEVFRLALGGDDDVSDPARIGAGVDGFLGGLRPSGRGGKSGGECDQRDRSTQAIHAVQVTVHPIALPKRLKS